MSIDALNLDMDSLIRRSLRQILDLLLCLGDVVHKHARWTFVRGGGGGQSGQDHKDREERRRRNSRRKRPKKHGLGARAGGAANRSR